MKSTILHGSCHDGYTSALMAFDYYINADPEDRCVYFADITPADWSSKITQLSDRFLNDPSRHEFEVMSFDIAYKREQVIELLKLFPQAKIYDRHQFTLDEIPDPEDQKKFHLTLKTEICGCRLAGEKFFPNREPSQF